MSDEDREAPTPRQTGTYGFMLSICRDSKLDLERWLPSVPQPIEKRVIELIQEFKKLSVRVQGWTIDTPQESKRATVDLILELRAEAQGFADRYGYKLR